MRIVIDFLPTVVIIIIVLLMIRISYIVINKTKCDICKEIINLLFIGYIIILSYLLSYKSLNPYWTSNNYILFSEILRYNIFSKIFIKEIIGNLIMFIPFGLYISYYLNLKKIYLLIFLTLLITVVIELIQKNIGRVFDIDDILLNNLGSYIGYFVFKLKKIEK